MNHAASRGSRSSCTPERMVGTRGKRRFTPSIPWKGGNHVVESIHCDTRATSAAANPHGQAGQRRHGGRQAGTMHGVDPVDRTARSVIARPRKSTRRRAPRSARRRVSINSTFALYVRGPTQKWLHASKSPHDVNNRLHAAGVSFNGRTAALQAADVRSIRTTSTFRFRSTVGRSVVTRRMLVRVEQPEP